MFAVQVVMFFCLLFVYVVMFCHNLFNVFLYGFFSLNYLTDFCFLFYVVMFVLFCLCGFMLFNFV